MIKVSDTAKKKVVELMTDDGFNPTTDYVRVGVKGGGCSGLSYDLKFDHTQAEEDKIFEDNGFSRASLAIPVHQRLLDSISTSLEYKPFRV